MGSMTNGLAGAEGSEARAESDQEAKDRALIERMAASAPMSSAPMSLEPRSFASRGKERGRARLWTKPEETEERAFAIGWKMSLVFDILLVVTPILLVMALPPFLACRERERTFGFFVGDTVRTCTSRGIQHRWQTLDSRLKMLVRSSGR